MAITFCLVTHILQNIFFCVEQKKEIHTGLKQRQGGYIMTEFPFLVNCPFKALGYFN